MSRVIALFNQCGGVGKSTLTMNLGYYLQERSHRVLLIDYDRRGEEAKRRAVQNLEIPSKRRD